MKSSSFSESLRFALQGMNEIRHHPNFRRQVMIGVAAIVVGWLVSLSRLEWALLILTIGLVITSEMANSAIEETVDLQTKEHRLEAKRAKDFGAAMVLLASAVAIIVGIFLFGPKILALLSS